MWENDFPSFLNYLSRKLLEGNLPVLVLVLFPEECVGGLPRDVHALIRKNLMEIQMVFIYYLFLKYAGNLVFLTLKYSSFVRQPSLSLSASLKAFSSWEFFRRAMLWRRDIFSKFFWGNFDAAVFCLFSSV